MSVSFVLTCLLVATQGEDLRDRIEAAAQDGVSATELESLSQEAFSQASDSSPRSGFWSAMGLVAELCRHAPHVEARAVRARALTLLATRDSDSMRWSSLVTQQFLPGFSDLPQEAWSAELAEYDRVLDELAASGVSERAQAELGFARAFARVQLNRQQDWLSDAQRLDTVERLGQLRARFGEHPTPGSGTPAGKTLGARASAYEYELTRLRFGAPAPTTAGSGLDGRPLDLEDHAGRIVVLDFWTSFCQPCLALVPSTRALLAELAGEPVVYLGVCGDEDRLAGRSTAQRVGMTWRSLWDGSRGTDGPAATAWRVNDVGWPTVFVLDGKGLIRHKLYGKEAIESRLEGDVRGLLRKRREAPQPDAPANH